MELEKVGVLRIDDAKLRRKFPEIKPGTYHAVHDISLANGLRVGPPVPDSSTPKPGEPPKRGVSQPYPTILGIAQIRSD
jgi:hypothetical protein